MTNGRLAILVGFAVDAKQPAQRNTKEMREAYVEHTLARGYRAYLRGDGCEGRRFRHFVERGIERKRLSEDLVPACNRPVSVQRLRGLEARGMLLAAILDLVPSLLYSGWMLLPRRRKIKQITQRHNHLAKLIDHRRAAA